MCSSLLCCFVPGATALQLVRQQRPKPKARDEELIRLVGEVSERAAGAAAVFNTPERRRVFNNGFKCLCCLEFFEVAPCVRVREARANVE